MSQGALPGFRDFYPEQLATRIISEQSLLPSERIRRGRIDSEEFDRIVEVSAAYQQPIAG